MTHRTHDSPAGPEPAGAPDLAEGNPDRLDGWKEIGAYLRRAPRTAQRWETHLGLPVHRIGGEIVYALRSEIDAWVASEAARSAQSDGNGGKDGPDARESNGGASLRRTADEPDREAAVPTAADHHTAASESRWRQFRTGRARWWFAAIALVFGAAGFLGTGRIFNPPALHEWRVSGGELRALGADGRELWMYQLPTRDSEPAGGTGGGLLDDQRRAIIDDIDGDGRTELAFISRPPDPRQSRLFVFGVNGDLRFSYQRVAGADFGGVPQRGPYAAAWIDATTNTDGSKSLWLQSRHVPFFAAVIEQLDPRTGQRLSEYWNGGAISHLAVGRFAGRRLVFIGGDANEGHGATLAVFQEGRVGGGNVGGDDAHTCSSCGPVQAEAIFLFPRHDVGTAAPSESKISLIGIKDETEVLVDVEYFHAEVPGLEGRHHAIAHFMFDKDLNLVHAEHYNGYRIIHDFFFRTGRLDHSYGDRDRAELVPIRRWSGRAFEPVYPAVTNLLSR